MKNTYYCLGIVIVAALAKLKPDIGRVGGILRPEITSRYIGGSISFLIMGLTLPVQDLSRAVKKWDLHLYVQGFTFIIFPCIMTGLVFFLKYIPIHPPLLEGFKILGTTPPSVSSAITMTKLVGGNVAVATLNTIFGFFLGIFITPVFIVLLIGSYEVDVPTIRFIKYLFLVGFIPLMVGKVIKKYQKRWLQHYKTFITTFSQIVGLFSFYATFCQAFSRDHFRLELDTFSLVTTFFIIIALHVAIKLLLLLSFRHIFHYAAEDAVAVMFVGSRKSLSLGLTLVEIIFEDSSEVGCLSIPLLIYNPVQIIIGSISVELLKMWLTGQKRRSRTTGLPLQAQQKRGASYSLRTPPMSQQIPSNVLVS